MKEINFIGKTFQELADNTGVLWNIAHIFVVPDENDLTGTRLMDAYNLKQVILQFPATADAIVVSAKEFCGETFIFIKA